MKLSKKDLLEKLFKAKIELGDVRHSMTCPMEDPESYAPCSCKEKETKGFRDLVNDTINYLLEN